MLCMAAVWCRAMLAGLSIDKFGYASVFTLSLIGIIIALLCIGLLTLSTQKNRRTISAS